MTNGSVFRMRDTGPFVTLVGIAGWWPLERPFGYKLSGFAPSAPPDALAFSLFPFLRYIFIGSLPGIPAGRQAAGRFLSGFLP